MPYARTQRPRGAYPYDDAPDTDAAFRRIAALPDGPERTALRQEVPGRRWPNGSPGASVIAASPSKTSSRLPNSV
jgi:hypothetical protein